MKKKRNLLFIIIPIVVVAITIICLFFLLNDKNKLTVEERRWVNDNINTIQNINVVNNALVFGKDGSGVFYDFLNDFSKEYELQVNPITYNDANVPEGNSFGIKTSITDQDKVFYKDHFVLLSKDKKTVINLDNLNNKSIGVLSKDQEYVSKYIKNITINYIPYETITEAYQALDGELEYLIVPLIDQLDQIISKNYYITYHFSDINYYYVMQTNGDMLSNVLVKYYEKWQESIDEYYNKSLFKVFSDTLKITESEIDQLQSIVYKYGFVNNSPYEVIIGGEYGGIVAVYLQHFSEFANLEFNFNKYRSFEKLQKDISNNKVDVFFNYYNTEDNYTTIDGPNINYSIIANRNNSKVINSIYSLINENVYVLENSKLFKYVSSIEGINVKTYKNIKELKKIEKDDYVLIDTYIYDYLSNKELNKYTKRYSDIISLTYDFKIKDNTTLANLMNKYLNILDDQEIINDGLHNHYETIKSGTIVSSIAKYLLYIVLIALFIIYFVIRKTKKITIAKKIKKDDKMKFIDQLTSLKNRNYLAENIEVWNNNTIYPQTIIVIDLNKLQEINDINGYNEGDKQIQAAANALVKTQLDNSEIMRTDGNEFVIYLVGYSQKQITNYIHKLNKEINKLPYQYGAEFGYSMITDNIKTVEDAMNEAVDDMKKQKEKHGN